MCAQCMATAATAVGVASGARAYLGSRRFSWLTPSWLKAITFALVAAAIVAATGVQLN